MKQNNGIRSENLDRCAFGQIDIGWSGRWSGSGQFRIDSIVVVIDLVCKRNDYNFGGKLSKINVKHE